VSYLRGSLAAMVTVEQVRAVALSLPRSYEAIVRDRIKFRVGQIVYVAFSRDESTIGFGFPKEERVALIESAPDKFFMPNVANQRYHWVEAWMSALDEDEMREFVIDAWRMCVPKKVRAAFDANEPQG
jgi:hypothetical protein